MYPTKGGCDSRASWISRRKGHLVRSTRRFKASRSSAEGSETQLVQVFPGDWGVPGSAVEQSELLGAAGLQGSLVAEVVLGSPGVQGVALNGRCVSDSHQPAHTRQIPRERSRVNLGVGVRTSWPT